MHILWTIVVSIFVGLAVRFLMPEKSTMDIVGVTLLGIAGSFMAPWVLRQFNIVIHGDVVNFAAKVLGAIASLCLMSVLQGALRRSTSQEVLRK